MDTLTRNALVLVGLACSSCGPTNTSGTDATAATDAATAAETATDAPLSDSAAQDTGVTAPIPVLNDCTEADYVDRSGDAQTERTVVPVGSTGYDPRCLTIRAGQSVVFSMDFTAHPLSPGVPHGSSAGATTPTPITAQTTGTMHTVTFSSPGFYPFFCIRHGHVGMAGTVQVLP